MNTIILTVAFLAAHLSPLGAQIVYADSITPDVQYVADLPTIGQIQTLVASEADLAGVDPKIALYIVSSESNFDPSRQSNYPDPTGPNGQEDSWGLWQIHLPAHPDITKAEALDPVWSTEWAVEQLKSGNCKIWTTCPLK